MMQLNLGPSILHSNRSLYKVKHLKFGTTEIHTVQRSLENLKTERFYYFKNLYWIPYLMSPRKLYYPWNVFTFMSKCQNLKGLIWLLHFPFGIWTKSSLKRPLYHKISNINYHLKLTFFLMSSKNSTSLSLADGTGLEDIRLLM